MAENEQHFRELIPPGTNFEFVGKRRRYIWISLLAVLASVAMLFVNQARHGDVLNWNIDFKGGTEIIFGVDKEGGVDSGEVRTALAKAGVDGFDVSELSWEVTEADGSTRQAEGFLVRTIDFGAIAPDAQLASAEKFVAQFKDHEILKASWHGDALHVRAKKPISEEEAATFFTGLGLEMKPWGELAADFATPTEGTGEYNLTLSIFGIDRQYQRALEQGIAGAQVRVEQVYAVGAKAGKQLRDDGIKAMFYAMLLIMLYLAFRFDIRYAPGAVAALLHDAVLVVGVFAVTWTEFSLTTVAAILTVIGYSVNDTVIIFDRVRENLEKLKDKKLARVVNISLNETLSRSLLTAATVFAVTLMMNIFGTGMVRNFAFAMNIGVLVGAYSSLFIASPIFIWIHQRYYASVDATPRRGKPTRKPLDEPTDDDGAAEPA